MPLPGYPASTVEVSPSRSLPPSVDPPNLRLSKEVLGERYQLERELRIIGPIELMRAALLDKIPIIG
jgi:hypothetical protein